MCVWEREREREKDSELLKWVSGGWECEDDMEGELD